jgi:hypothetical protein
VSRRPPLVLLALLLVGLAVALALAVPWTPLPGADLQPDASLDFTAEQIAREVAFHDALRPTSYASLALGLVVVSVLGVTRLGAPSGDAGRASARRGLGVAGAPRHPGGDGRRAAADAAAAGAQRDGPARVRAVDADLGLVGRWTSCAVCSSTRG